MTNLVVEHRESPHCIRLELNRPEKRNALSTPLLQELCNAIEKANEDPQKRVLLLSGSGPVFCAGLDLNEAMDPSKAHSSAQMVAKTLHTLYSSPLVTIACAHGAAMAGGAGLLAACDIKLITEDFRLGFPETKRGLVAGLVMTLLRRQMSENHLRELLLTAEPIDALRAKEMGLVKKFVEKERLIEEALTLAQSVIQGAPQAIAQTKQLLDNLHHRPLSEDLQIALEAHMQARCSEEAEEGITAFLEKREPSWL